ncbi:MAG: Uma2 family endonuclease [Peptococcaceae bacterium]|nr:Uma2 family endonuclease [Peptococcaceae bacterium]
MPLLVDREEPMPLEEFVHSRYIDENYELCGGELVAMSPARVSHEMVVMNILYLFRSKLFGSPCSVFPSNLGIYFEEDDSFVMADASIICDKSKIVDEKCVRPPELVVEVLSPPTAKYCFGRKRDLYKRFGVQEYWIVDADKKEVLVENFVQDQKILYRTKGFVKSELISELVLSLDDIFEGV